VIELEDLPELHDAVMIAAFEGWNDAGEAASAVIEHLAEVLDAEVVAALDPEDYSTSRSTGPASSSRTDDAGSAGAPPGSSSRRTRRSGATSSSSRASSPRSAGGPSPSS
jgi:hypothetical protein